METTPRSQCNNKQKAAKVSDRIGYGAIGVIGASEAKEWCQWRSNLTNSNAIQWRDCHCDHLNGAI
jgi:hypothetical protein